MTQVKFHISECKQPRIPRCLKQLKITRVAIETAFRLSLSYGHPGWPRARQKPALTQMADLISLLEQLQQDYPILASSRGQSRPEEFLVVLLRYIHCVTHDPHYQEVANLVLAALVAHNVSNADIDVSKKAVYQIEQRFEGRQQGLYAMIEGGGMLPTISFF